MKTKNDIIKQLNKDEIRNINMINFMKNYPIHYIDTIGDSVIVKGISDKEWIYVSSKSVDELKLLRNRLGNGIKNFAAVEDWMVPILANDYIVKGKLSTMKLILPDNITIENYNCEMSQLTIDDATFIYKNSDYKDFLSTLYITERITNGLNSCIRHRNTPIAWAMTQDDGAIGFLHVLPEYRRKGYGNDVMIDLIRKVRESNKVPFVHIELENKNSMHLATSLGFKEDKNVNWFEIIE